MVRRACPRQPPPCPTKENLGKTGEREQCRRKAPAANWVYHHAGKRRFDTKRKQSKQWSPPSFPRSGGSRVVVPTIATKRSQLWPTAIESLSELQKSRGLLVSRLAHNGREY